jgi:SAM-dependent methyltransferase
MAALRKFGQGVGNVVRFNWPFYALALGLAAMLALAAALGPPALRPWPGLALAALLLPVLASLAATIWVYDLSPLYRLDWLPVKPLPGATLLSLSAGFDEISPVLRRCYAPPQLLAADFYDPARHTEASIARARRAYPPAPDTLPVSTRALLPWPDGAIDATYAFLAAHEIRDAAERAAFFRELGRVTRPRGFIVVTEHLRDWPNFLAYNIGFLHFHSRRAWLATFAQAGLHVQQEVRLTPFITSFILRPHGNAA